MRISAIVAMANNRVIGKNNDIPWYLPADLKYFKKVTLGHHVIMGRKCFESIGRPLPKRTNVIITRNLFYMSSGCLITHTLEEALQIAKDNQEAEAFIIGGAQIYELAMPYLDRIYLTEVDLEVDGDVRFPELDMGQWNLLSEEAHQADEKNKYGYVFKVLEKKEAEES